MTIPESEPSLNIGAQTILQSNEVVSTENVSKTVLSSNRRRPRYIDMVIEAVKNLKSSRGTSLQAIKKYSKETYLVTAVILANDQKGHHHNEHRNFHDWKIISTTKL